MTYVIRSSGKKEEFDGEKLISSIMEAANNAGVMDQIGIEDIIKNVTSNTISYAQTQKEVQSKTLKDAILAQILKIGIQMAMQKFGANVSKENIINELISAGLQMSSKSSSQSNDLLSQLLGAGTSKSSSQSNDLLSQLLGAGTSKSSSQSNDLLSQLLGAGTSKSSSQSNDLLSQLLGAGTSSRTRASNDNLGEMLKAGMKLANALMK